VLLDAGVGRGDVGKRLSGGSTPGSEHLGSLVPPGSYAQLKLMQEDDECIGEDAGGGITLLAESGGDYQVATTPA
jgi:hypothetical protein